MYSILFAILLLVVVVALCFVQFKTGGMPPDNDPANWQVVPYTKPEGQLMIREPAPQFTKTKVEIRPAMPYAFGVGPFGEIDRFGQQTDALAQFNDIYRPIMNWMNMFGERHIKDVQLVKGKILINIDNSLYMPDTDTPDAPYTRTVKWSSDKNYDIVADGQNYKFIAENGKYYLVGETGKYPFKNINIKVDLFNEPGKATFTYNNYVYRIDGINNYMHSSHYTNMQGVTEQSNSSIINVNGKRVVIVEYEGKPYFYNVDSKKIEDAPTFVQ